MNLSILRPALPALFCLGLFGCAVGVKSTDLKEVPSRSGDTALLKPVGYVIHDEVLPGKHAVIDKSYLDSERRSWIDAASNFTDPKNIFLMSDGKPANNFNSFDEFAKTHPVVDVYVKAAPDQSGLGLDDVAYGSFWLTFLTLGITPAYLPIPYTASFTLSMPGDNPLPLSHWDYAYDRQEFFWMPLLIPMENYLDTFSGADNNNKLWETEEKRRLILRFL
ncbi:MAG: hypothetical protein WCE58_07595, partial [Gallionella sp.]